MSELSTTKNRSEPSRGLVDSVFRALPDLWFWTKPDGTVVDYRAGDEGSFYVPPDVFVGKRLADVLPGPLAVKFSDAAVRALATGDVVTVEYEIELSSGSRWFECRVARLDSGDCTLLLTARDVTERRQYEERLRHIQKLEALGTLAGGHAHNFNNLLMVILGNAERALADRSLDGRTRDMLKDIYTAAARGRDVVDQILAFSRASEAPADVVDAGRVVADSLDLLRSSMSPRVRLHFQNESGPMPVKLSPTQLAQVVMNLCSNARQAIEASGTVAVSLADDSHEGERYVVLRVADDGVGMTSDVAARAFDPFFTTKRIGERTGLGLSTVHGIVRGAGGFARIASRPGEGTEVEVWLPRREHRCADG